MICRVTICLQHVSRQWLRNSHSDLVLDFLSTNVLANRIPGWVLNPVFLLPLHGPGLVDSTITEQSFCLSAIFSLTHLCFYKGLHMGAGISQTPAFSPLLSNIVAFLPTSHPAPAIAVTAVSKPLLPLLDCSSLWDLCTLLFVFVPDSECSLHTEPSQTTLLKSGPLSISSA